MLHKHRALSLALVLLLGMALLGGCGRTSGQPEPEIVPEPTEEIVIYRGEPEMDFSEIGLEELRASLPELTELKTATLAKDSLRAEELLSLQELRPDVDFVYGFTVNGKTGSTTDTLLNLKEADTAELASWFSWAACMPALTTVELGEGEASDSRIPWEALAQLRAARPDVTVNYSFTLYGQSFTLDSTEMNLTHIPIDDQGALVKEITACMPKLGYLDMDTCGVDDEHMAGIRDALPQAEVVWRIWFGDTLAGRAGYSVRTNVDRILASNPGIGGELTPENTQSLKYCTKVKYLDLGHNSYMRSIDFVRYMPDLEAVVLAMGDWYDASPLENCSKLRYAELQTTCISDLRPLSKLTNLTDLNLCYCYALHDISPLYELPQLERLYLGKLTPVPAEQVAQMQSIAPNCDINTTTLNPTEGSWRYTGQDAYGNIMAPSYAWLREVMQYDYAPDSYSYSYNDPLY